MPELVLLSCLDSKSFKSYFEQHGNFLGLFFKNSLSAGCSVGNISILPSFKIQKYPTILLGSALLQYEVFPIRLSGCLVQLAKILSPNLISVTARLPGHICITIHMCSGWCRVKGKDKCCSQF